MPDPVASEAEKAVKEASVAYVDRSDTLLILIGQLARPRSQVMKKASTLFASFFKVIIFK